MVFDCDYPLCSESGFISSFKEKNCVLLFLIDINVHLLYGITVTPYIILIKISAISIINKHIIISNNIMCQKLCFQIETYLFCNERSYIVFITT